MTEPTNPFAALSLIVAPAVLTNASSILVLSTSNRLARAVDRARGLAIQLEGDRQEADGFGNFRMRELDSAEQRALMLLRALRFFYGALGAFASAAFISLLGAAFLRPALRNSRGLSRSRRCWPGSWRCSLSGRAAPSCYGKPRSQWRS